jgi:DNA-binding response OmpR family regulator
MGDMPPEKTSVILAMISDQSLDRELKKLLYGFRFELLSAPTAHTGLQMAEELLPDVILVDIDLDGRARMPAGGCAPTAFLRGMPILMLCRSDDHDSRALGLSAGADDFISKPFDAIELLSRLRTITPPERQAPDGNRPDPLQLDGLAR